MALVKGESTPKLYEIDFLLDVHDISRMGTLRFKLDPSGPFLDDNKGNSTPPITHLRELEASVKAYEEDEDGKNGDEWIPILWSAHVSAPPARQFRTVVIFFIIMFDSKNTLSGIIYNDSLDLSCH